MQHLLTDSRYLNDEVPSTTYFDDEGFFKTGDLAHKLNDHFIFNGRASIDCEFTQTFNCHIFFSNGSSHLQLWRHRLCFEAGRSTEWAFMHRGGICRSCARSETRRKSWCSCSIRRPGSHSAAASG